MILLASCTGCGCPISVWGQSIQLQCPACDGLNVTVAAKRASGSSV